MDLLLEVRPGEMLVHHVRCTFEPLFGLVVAVQLGVFVTHREPGRRRIGKHSVKGRRHQLSRVDRGAVKDQLAALVATRAFLCNVRLSRHNIVGHLLPVRLPVLALRFERRKPAQ